jgi:peptidoglycan-N-acetylglucosamine deacetylase
MRLRPLAVLAVAVAFLAGVAKVGRDVRASASPPGSGDLIALGKPVYCGGGTGPYVALTFDDGPTFYTRDLLQVLAQYGARATFFEIGRKAARHPRLVPLEAAAGEVADHSWSHPTMTGLSPARVVTQLLRAKRRIEKISGQPVDLFRPPFGDDDPLVASVAQGLGLLVVLWNVDSGDASAPSTPSPEVLARQLADRVQPGAIVLLHEDVTVPTAVNALRIFLPVLAQRGLKAVTVSELLQLDPPAPGSLGNVGACNVTWRG